MITLDNFEAIVPFKILMRGQEYYELGAVSDLEEASSGEWTATVDGTRSYTVEISLSEMATVLAVPVNFPKLIGFPSASRITGK